VSWSGGKDSCAAFERGRQDFEVVAALTMIDEDERRSRSHGIRVELLCEQTAAMGIAHVMRPCDWPSYEEEFAQGLRDLKAHDVSHVIFGDLLYLEHRQWAERLATRAGLIAVEPLWGQPTLDVVQAFLGFGGRALIVTVNAKWLDESWLGTELTPEGVRKLIELGVDPCGENGEYHTFVIDSPGFSHSVQVTRGEVVNVRGCWALDLLPVASRATAQAP
jgi:uncharacterized protein (TIGR00290 family)